MNILEFKYNEIINKNVDNITENIARGKSFKNFIKPKLKKCFLRLTFIEMKVCILIIFLQRMKKQPKILKEISEEIKDINSFELSLNKCENYFHLLWQEFEILVNQITK